MAYVVLDGDHSVSGASQSGFRPMERVAVVLGAAAFGALLGLGATIALGALEPWVVAACAAPFYLAALHFSFEACRESLGHREWPALLVGGLLLLGLAAWPIAVFYSSPDSPAFWIGPAATLSALAMFTLCAEGQAPRVYRASALGLVIALLAVNQSFLTVMGA